MVRLVIKGGDRDRGQGCKKIGMPPERNSNGDEMTGSQQWRLNPDRSWTNTSFAIEDRPHA